MERYKQMTAAIYLFRVRVLEALAEAVLAGGAEPSMRLKALITKVKQKVEAATRTAAGLLAGTAPLLTRNSSCAVQPKRGPGRSGGTQERPKINVPIY